MLMLNPNDNQYYNVPDSLVRLQGQNPYQNPLNGVFGQGYQQPPVMPNMNTAPMAQPAAMGGQQSPQFTVRPAANISEVQATMIGLGTVNLFYNQRAGEIYISRYANDGAKEIEVFALKQPEPPAEAGAAGTAGAAGVSGMAGANGQSAAQSVAPPVDLSGVYARLDELKTMIEGGRADDEHEPATDVTGAKGRNKPASADKHAAPAAPAAGGDQPASEADVGYGTGKK